MASSGEHPSPHAQHAISYASYLLIWLGLISLTAVTVAVAGIDLGRWVILTALGIASIKTLLVVAIFMHLKFEDRVFRVFLGVALLTLAIFIVLTFFDYAFS